MRRSAGNASKTARTVADPRSHRTRATSISPLDNAGRSDIVRDTPSIITTVLVTFYTYKRNYVKSAPRAGPWKQHGPREATAVYFNAGAGSGDDVTTTARPKCFFTTATTSATCTLPIRAGNDFSKSYPSPYSSSIDA